MVYNLWKSAFVQKFDFFWFTKSYLLYALLFKIEEKHVEDLQGIKVSKNIVTLRSYPRHSIVFSHSLSAWISMIHWSSPTVELTNFFFFFTFSKNLSKFQLILCILKESTEVWALSQSGGRDLKGEGSLSGSTLTVGSVESAVWATQL